MGILYIVVPLLLLIGWKMLPQEPLYPHTVELPSDLKVAVILSRSPQFAHRIHDEEYMTRMLALSKEFDEWLIDNNIWYKLKDNTIRFRYDKQAMLFKLRWC